MYDINNYRSVFNHPNYTGWTYRFPNGHVASVIPDLHQPMRFEILVDGDARQVYPGLTTDEAEAKLAEVAALPA